MKSIDMYVRQNQRVSTKLMKNVTMFVMKELSGYKVDFQQLVFEKVLGHLVMKGVFPIYSNLLLS